MFRQLDDDSMLFVQYSLEEYMRCLLSGVLTLTQQNYYALAFGELSDPEEGKQKVYSKGKQVTQFTSGNTFIWCSSVINSLDDLSTLKTFTDSHHGILIENPNLFLKEAINSITKSELVAEGGGENSVDIDHAHVIYIDESIKVNDDDETWYNRWTKRSKFENEREYRIVLHNLLTPEFEFIEENEELMKQFIVDVIKGETFYRVQFPISFDHFVPYIYNNDHWEPL